MYELQSISIRNRGEHYLVDVNHRYMHINVATCITYQSPLKVGLCAWAVQKVRGNVFPPVQHKIKRLPVLFRPNDVVFSDSTFLPCVLDLFIFWWGAGTVSVKTTPPLPRKY